MPPEMREKYAELSDTNTKLQKVIDKLQEEVDSITKQKAILQQQIYASPVSRWNAFFARLIINWSSLHFFFTGETRSRQIGTKTSRIGRKT